MKIQINREALVEAMRLVGTVVPPRPPRSSGLRLTWHLPAR